MKKKIISIPTLIPQNKIKGLRFGQLMCVAIAKYKVGKIGEYIADKLFYIENKELEKIIKDYLKAVK